MMAPQVGDFSKQYWRQIHVAVATLLIAVYVAIHIFTIGGDEFVINLNNNIATPLSLGVTIVAALLWRRMVVGNQSRVLWAGMCIGWTFWTIAEAWWGIAAALSQEVPYPSGADYFWLVGYIPMGLGLWMRIRALPVKPGPLQQAGIWLASLVTVLFTVFFVLAPILQNNDPTRLLESILNLLYPLLDLVLLIIVLYIFVAYQKGHYGWAWSVLSIGFLLHSISNLLFSYASVNNLYYPDMRVNLISALVDIPYNTSYLFWLMGLYVLHGLSRQHRPLEGIEAKLALVPNTHVLVLTDAGDRATDVSQNYSRVFSLAIAKGKKLSEVLGISKDEADMICARLRTEKMLKEQPVRVKTQAGAQEARLSGVAIIDLGGEYSGASLLMRVLMQDNSLDEELTDYQKSMVASLLRKSDTEEEEIRQLLSSYYLAYLKALYNRIYSEGRAVMADAFLAELQSVADQHGWKVTFGSGALFNMTDLPLSDLRGALPVWLNTGRQFVARVTDEKTADAIVQYVHSQFDDSVHRNVARYGKAA